MRVFEARRALAAVQPGALAVQVGVTTMPRGRVTAHRVVDAKYSLLKFVIQT